MARIRKALLGTLAGATVTAWALTTAVPGVAHASQSHDSPVSASSLNMHEPDAQHIQAELDLVHSEGLPIRVVQHTIIPLMKVPHDGQLVLTSNVPVVEFEIGQMPGEVTNGSATSLSMTGRAFRVRGATVQSTRAAHRSADNADTSQWQDNQTGGGNPYFIVTAHFNTTSTTDGQGHVTYYNTTTLVTHKATDAEPGAIFQGQPETVGCNSSSYNGQYYGGGSNWGTEYFDNIPAVTCQTYSSYLYDYGTWINGHGQLYESCYQSAPCPGNWIKY